MRLRAYLIAAVALAAAPAVLLTTMPGCGSSVMIQEDAPDAGSDDDGGFVFIDSGKPDSQPDAHQQKDALPDYEDPGCPDQPEPIKDFQCDPYNQNNGDCAADEACYIFVQYPDEPCGQETYGSFCAPAGSGQQGDQCGGGFDCGAGFVCVISGSGNQCVELCNLTGNSGCPPGMVCEPIDVEGFGGCL